MDEDGVNGLTEDAAADEVRSRGLRFRVVCRDGVNLLGTADLRRDRVNVGLQDGIVVFNSRH